MIAFDAGGCGMLAERRIRADIERKVQQIPHSTFGYVQDDELLGSL
jgi:hypothetical protein